MKILWVVNIMLPKIAGKLNLPYSNREGWLSGIFDMISSSNEYELAVACPSDPSLRQNEVTVDGVKCYLFHEDLSNPHIETPGLRDELKSIFLDFEPDILHIFGTEFPHGLLACEVFNNPDRTLVGIQGLCHMIAKDYMAEIPFNVQKSVTFRDLIRKDSIQDQKDKFTIRGEREKKLIKASRNITGRTAFDEKATFDINPDRRYFAMNETMRSIFYEGRWDGKSFENHSIFLVQGDYPIKGMHFLLMAAGELLKKYPDIMIYIAGNSIISVNSLKDRIKTPAYGRYLRKLIALNQLEGHIKVLGNLSSEQMKEQYLKSSVLVCPSFVENSPNTIAEAMLLGVPVVCSDAGGITSVISDTEGFIFERGNCEMLASKLDEVFEMEQKDMDSLSKKMELAYTRAHSDYDGNTNYSRLLQIYRLIMDYQD